jgi:predicted nucleotidyltransferase
MNNIFNHPIQHLISKISHWFHPTKKIKTPTEEKTGVIFDSCIKPSEIKKYPEKVKELETHLQGINQPIQAVTSMRKQLNSLLASSHPFPEKGKLVGQASSDCLRIMLDKFLADGEKSLMNKLGQKPCEYSCVVFGSTARDDGGAYPDLDFGFIIEEKNQDTNRYFELLSQYVADRIHLLGESTPGENYGVHACYGGATPLFKSWGWRYQNIAKENKLKQALSNQKEQYQKLLHNISKHISWRKGGKQLKKLISRTANIAVPTGIKSLVYKHFRARSPKALQYLKSDFQRLENLEQRMGENAKELEVLEQADYELHRLYSAGRLQRVRGTGALISTPKELAKWTKPDIDRTIQREAREGADKHEMPARTLAWQISNISDYCDYKPTDNTPTKQSLVDELHTLRTNILNERPTNSQHVVKKADGTSVTVDITSRTQEKFVNNLITNRPNLCQSLPNEGIIDVKRELWRYPQLVISHLSLLHGLSEMNSFDRIDSLEKQGILSTEAAEKLRDVYGFLVCLRAKCQLHYKSEIHKIFPSEHAKNAYIANFENQRGQNIDQLLEICNQKIEGNDKRYIEMNNILLNRRDEKELRYITKGIEQERKKLYKEKEELNHMKALKDGMVLSDDDREYITTNLLPFLQVLKETTIDYSLNGMQGQMM